VKGDNIMHGKVRDLTGETFGKWTVVSYAYTKQGKNQGIPQWNCVCECGTEKVVSGKMLKGGQSKSCGCSRKENKGIGERTKTHGMSKTRLYKIWAKIKYRCFDQNYPEFQYYGGRGITVCDEWLEFEPFMKWANENGYNNTLSIDRIDYDGNYEPSNCKWATNEEQANNKSNNVKLEYNGKTLTLAQWARELGMERYVLANRYKRGYPVEKILYKGNLRYANTEVNK
jgi:hypothetical protein